VPGEFDIDSLSTQLSRNEAETRVHLIDPALRVRGWTEDMNRREETLGTVEIVEGRPRR